MKTDELVPTEYEVPMTAQSLPRRRRAATPPVRVHVGYIRVSTEDQVENGVSLDAQRERLTAHAVAMGRELASVASDEGVSAKSLDRRPALSALLASVRAGRIASVTVLKLDRLTRSVRDLSELLEIFRKADCALVSVTEALDTTSASGRMVVNMLGVFAQWERETIGERTSFALAHKRRNGRVYGRTPFGYRRDGVTLVSDPHQQAIVARMQALRAAGASFAAVADEMTRCGIAPPKGSRWHSTSVRDVLLSKMTLEAAA